MIHHAVSEGLLLLRQRAGTSAILALALAVPIALAGVGMAVNSWLDPVAELSSRQSSVAVLLRPQLDADLRGRWVAEQSAAHPGWTITEVSSEELAERLGRWFPYLEDLVGTGDASMPPLIEIATADVDSLSGLEDLPEVLAVGPQSSVQQLLGRVARRLSVAVAVLSAVLLAAAVLLAVVWVHLELYRHADELTIMRLVGATEGTIRGPFVVAVGVTGAAAGGLAVFGTMAAAAALSRMVTVLGLPGVVVTPAQMVVELAIAVILPVAAAAVTLSRHAAEEFFDG
jgi:cell division transport system permease protein